MAEKLHVDVFIFRIRRVRPLSVVFQVVFLRILERVGVADLWTGRSKHAWWMKLYSPLHNCGSPSLQFCPQLPIILSEPLKVSQNPLLENRESVWRLERSLSHKSRNDDNGFLPGVRQTLIWLFYLWLKCFYVRVSERWTRPFKVPVSSMEGFFHLRLE